MHCWVVCVHLCVQVTLMNGPINCVVCLKIWLWLPNWIAVCQE